MSRRDEVTALPSYNEVLRLPSEVEPTVVPPSFEDENGHMNIRHYFDLSTDAIGVVFERVGITDDYRAARGRGFFTAEHHLRYLAECHVGDTVSVRFRFIERSDKVLHGMTLLVNHSTRRLACTLEFVATHVDLASRRVTPFDEDVAESVDKEFALTTGIDWPAPVCGVMGVRRR